MSKNGAAATKNVKPLTGDLSVKVTSTLNVRPSKLRLTEKFQGRYNKVSDENIIHLADSMNVKAGGVGQQQPIQVRPVEDTNEFEVIFGNTRTLAAHLITTGYTSNDKKERQPQPDFTLRCEVVEVDDSEAFKRNVSENATRNVCSPIDNAVNQAKLRDEYQMSDVAIARLYGYASSASVNRLKKLLTLPSDIQNMIHKGTVTLQAGILLSEFLEKDGPDDFTKMWGSVTTRNDEDGSIGASEVSTAIKDYRAAKKQAVAGTGNEVPVAGTEQPGSTGDITTPTTDAGPTGTPTGDGTPTPDSGVKALTLKEFKMVLGNIKDDAKCPPMLKTSMEFMLSVAAGGNVLNFVRWWNENVEEVVKHDGADKQFETQTAANQA